jgi:hypothetical protein
VAAEVGEERITLPQLEAPNTLQRTPLSSNWIDRARQRGDGASPERVQNAGAL